MPINHCFLILDKSIGISSAKAVAEVKRLLKCKKIGHGGTLDPLASGVLPLAIGEATKAFSYVASSVKEYHFTITFGEERSTGDAEGGVTARTDFIPTEQDIERVLPEFTGCIMQIPPVYSALNIGGKRAYERARAGEQVEMVARPVEVYDLKLLKGGEHSSSPSLTLTPSFRGVVANTPPCTLASDLSLATCNLQRATLSLACGKGTYVRSLARDIARKCNSLGYVSMLRRVSVGKFHERNAISLDKLPELVHNAALTKSWVPIELALDDIPAIDVDSGQALLLRHGKTILVNKPDGEYMALFQGHILALAEIKGGTLRSQRIFNIN